MRIATKVIAFEDPQMGMGVSSFFLYYKLISGEAPPSFAYDDPHLTIPAVQGQKDYQVQIPGQLPLTEGQYALGFAAADAEGNISDIAVLVRFFDFTAPLAPVNIRVL